MMQDIELIDRDYGVVNKDKRLSCCQIKTRESSFNNIKSKWNKFRLTLLTKKLDRLKQEIVTHKFVADNDSRITARSESKLLSKATAIARVEEKIKILSREDVPTNYVSNRAIKLKKRMMDNLTFNCGNAYSVGIDKIDEVFADDNVEAINSVETTNSAEVAEKLPEPMAAISDTSDVNDVNDVNDIETEENDEVQVISPEDVDAVVNGIQNADENELKTQDLADIVNAELNNISVDADTNSEGNSEDIEEPVDAQEIGNAILDAVKTVNPSNMFTFDPENTHVAESTSSNSSDVTSNNPYRADTVSSSNMFTFPTETGDTHSSSLTDDEIEQNIIDAINADSSSVTNNDNDSIEDISSSDIKADIEAALARLKVSKREGKSVDFNKFNSDGEVVDFSNLSEDDYDIVMNNDNTEEFVVTSDDDVLSEHKNEYIPGTDIFKPRDRGVYESDEEYVEFLRQYYEAAFTKPANKSRDSYVPMTPEEIQQARENIEYDKYEKIYADEWQKIKNKEKKQSYIFDVPSFKNIFHPADPNATFVIPTNEETVENGNDVQIREYPVVVPERITGFSKNKDIIPEYKEDLTFDFSGDTVKDVNAAFKTTSSIDGFKALSARVRDLQEKKKRQLRRQQEIQSEALKTEELARKIKQDRAKAQEIYDENMRRLAEYTQMLAEQCSDIENETQVVYDNAEANRRFIQEQEEKAKSYEELNGQIDEILAGDVTVHRGRR